LNQRRFKTKKKLKEMAEPICRNCPPAVQVNQAFKGIVISWETADELEHSTLKLVLNLQI